MYRVIKFFRSRNGAIISIPIRKFASRSMAEFFATSLGSRYADSDDIVIGFQKI